MQMNHYSEQDVQDYACGKYTGNVAEFEVYLKENPSVLAQVQEYQNLYSLIKTENIPALSFNLADMVISKIHQKPALPKSRPLQLFPYLLIALGAIAVLITSRFFYSHLNIRSGADIGLLVLSGIVMLIFFAGFYIAEARQRQNRFAFYT